MSHRIAPSEAIGNTAPRHTDTQIIIEELQVRLDIFPGLHLEHRMCLAKRYQAPVVAEYILVGVFGEDIV